MKDSNSALVSEDFFAVQAARFITQFDGEKIPPQARQMALDAILDCIACAMAARDQPLTQSLLSALSSSPIPNQGNVPLIGLGRFASPADAALINGTIAHALDYDDITHPAYAHPTVVLFPAMMAVAHGKSGRDLIDAYVIGIEIFGKLGRVLNTAHYRQGWHATSTFGSIAAAAVCARLLGLTETQAMYAIGIAASSSSGLRANFGTPTKPLHAGMAARNGILAAQLAQAGIEANKAVFEHPSGFAAAFNGNPAVEWELAGPFDQDRLEILSQFGLALKPFPACGATHCAIEAAMNIRDRLGRQMSRDVQGITVGVPQMAFEPLIQHFPITELEAKFSMHFCVAAALIDGAISLSTFTMAKIAEPEIVTLMEKVSMVCDDRMKDNSEFGVALTVTTGRGERHESIVPLAKGKPKRWLKQSELAEKFLECLSFGGFRNREHITTLYNWLRLMDSQEPADHFIAPLSMADPDRSPALD